MTTINITTPTAGLVNVGSLMQAFIREVCDPEQVAGIDWWHAVSDTVDINIYGEDGYISVCAYLLDEDGHQTGDYTNLAHFNIASVGLKPEELWP